MHRAAVVAAPVPDRLATPVVRLIPVLAMAAVLDIDVDWRRQAFLVVRLRLLGVLIKPLLFERPADHLVIGAAGKALRRPIRGIGFAQRGGKMPGISRAGRDCQRSDGCQQKMASHASGKSLVGKRRRIAADGAVEAEHRRRQDLLVAIAPRIQRIVEWIEPDLAVPAPAVAGGAVMATLFDADQPRERVVAVLGLAA